jgi:hypothetical protein
LGHIFSVSIIQGFAMGLTVANLESLEHAKEWKLETET